MFSKIDSNYLVQPDVLTSNVWWLSCFGPSTGWEFQECTSIPSFIFILFLELLDECCCLAADPGLLSVGYPCHRAFSQGRAKDLCCSDALASAKNEYLWKSLNQNYDIQSSKLLQMLRCISQWCTPHFPNPVSHVWTSEFRTIKRKNTGVSPSKNHPCLSEVSSPLVVLPSTGGLKDESN